MNIEDVEKLAGLARISLNEEEKQEILKDMGGILDYVKVIESVEVPEVHDGHKLRNVWREDVADQTKYQADKIIEQFPAKEGRSLKVKKIL